MTPIYTVRETAPAPPAMPFGRVLARAAAPFARGGGRLTDLYFDNGCRRVAEGRAARSIRFEIAEAALGDGLVIEIDPGRLTHELIDVVDDGGETVRLSHWFLDGGDWKGAVRPLRPSEVQQEIDAVFDHDDLEASPAFRSLLAKSEAGRPAERNRVSLTTPALILSYLEQYRDLRRSIERHGFQRRAAVPSATAGLFAGTAVRGRTAEAVEREIGLAVAPGGRLLRLGGGRHRTAIAQRLALPRIPAQIRLVHARWLARAMARTGLPPRQALVAGLRSFAPEDAARTVPGSGARPAPS